jgi:hypothetical protein
MGRAYGELTGISEATPEWAFPGEVLKNIGGGFARPGSDA